MNEEPHEHWCPHCDQLVPCEWAKRGGCIFPSSAPISCEPCAEHAIPLPPHVNLDEVPT